MKTKLLSFYIFMTLVLTTMSCSTPTSSITSSPEEIDGFTYTESGGSALISGRNARFSNLTKTLLVDSREGGLVFEITLNNTTAGTYALGTAFAISHKTKTFAPNAGSFTITQNADGKMSGSFVATGSPNPLTALNASFRNIPVTE